MLGESDTRRAGGVAEPSIAAASARADSARSGAASGGRISCIVCAYNEAERIRHILDAVRLHPALSEVIVVNDGSTDDTRGAAGGLSQHQGDLLRPQPGKTYALSRGIAEAEGEYLMLLDADLSGSPPPTSRLWPTR